MFYNTGMSAKLVLSQLLEEHGIRTDEIRECMGYKHKDSYYRMAISFQEGKMTLQRLHKLANCIGVPIHTLAALYAATVGDTEPEDSDEITLFVLENMRRRDPDLAFAYYLELLERDKVTTPIRAWADQYLSQLL